MKWNIAVMTKYNIRTHLSYIGILVYWYIFELLLFILFLDIFNSFIRNLFKFERHVI